MKQFWEGQTITDKETGIKYKIERGNRCEGDLKISFKTPFHDWFIPPLSHYVILVAFQSQVEENNYPQHRGYQGMEKLFRALRAGIQDWLAAVQKIKKEVALKKQRG